MKIIFSQLKHLYIIISALFLVACNTSETIEFVETPQAVQRSLNGVWADSSCEYNRDSRRYETIDYDINSTTATATILISSYQDNNCLLFTFEEVYEGEVSQTGVVTLSNGLQANRLTFSGYDRKNNTTLSHTAYFYADALFLYEYPNLYDNIAFEYEKVL